jgi:CHAT domain
MGADKPWPSPRHVLNADEYSLLAGYAVAVRQAPNDRVRELALAAVVQAAHYYHERGAAWAEIARALGVPVHVLREWRGTAGVSVKPRARRSASAVTGLFDASAHPQRHPAVRQVVLVALGTTNVSGNDFPGEAAAIRRVLRPHGIAVIERCAVELGELKQELDELHPAILHVAAHFDFGLVHLSAENGRTSATLTWDLCTSIRDTQTPPVLVVLNGCETASLSETLTDQRPGVGKPVTTAIGWRGRLKDPQAQLFAERLYAGLASGTDAGHSFAGPQITVTARWPGQVWPRLSDSPLTIPFPRD